MRKHIAEEIYKTIVEHLPILTVDIVIFSKDKRKILLCKRNNDPLKDIYYTTGGRIIKGETIKQAIKRKAKEELGIDINPDKLIHGGYIEEFFENSIFKRTNSHMLNIYFGTLMDEKSKFILDSQHSEYKWFNISDRNLHPYIKQRISTLLHKL